MPENKFRMGEYTILPKLHIKANGRWQKYCKQTSNKTTTKENEGHIVSAFKKSAIFSLTLEPCGLEFSWLVDPLL